MGRRVKVTTFFQKTENHWVYAVVLHVFTNNVINNFIYVINSCISCFAHFVLLTGLIKMSFGLKKTIPKKKTVMHSRIFLVKSWTHCLGPFIVVPNKFSSLGTVVLYRYIPAKFLSLFYKGDSELWQKSKHLKAENTAITLFSSKCTSDTISLL